MGARGFKVRCEFCGHEPVKVRSATIEEAHKYGATEYETESYYIGRCPACQMMTCHPSEEVGIIYDR